MIAKLWFNYIFPPRLIERVQTIIVEGANYDLTTYEIDEAANNVFAGLMIISTSLALGLVVGFATVQVLEIFFDVFACFQDRFKNDEKVKRARSRRAGMYSAPPALDDDPQSVAQELHKAIEHGVTNQAQADALFNAVDIDRSDTIDEGEVTEFMIKAGLTPVQIQKLFASMDTDGNGEVSREEFRRAVLDPKNEELLKPANLEVEESPVEDAKAGASGVATLTGTYGPTEGGVEYGKKNAQLVEGSASETA